MRRFLVNSGLGTGYHKDKAGIRSLEPLDAVPPYREQGAGGRVKKGSCFQRKSLQESMDCGNFGKLLG